MDSGRRKKVKKKDKETFYAVRRGKKSGVFKTWDECKAQVNGFPAPLYRKFHNYDDALAFVKGEYSEEDLDIPEELKVSLNYQLYDPEEEYHFDNWNRFSDNDILYVFTDGSSKPSGKGRNAITRYAIYFGKECMNVSQGLPNSTNNKCELTAILRTLDVIMKHKKELKTRMKCDDDDLDDDGNKLFIKKIMIVTDSEYSFKACKYNLEKWSSNNWIKSDGEDVKNQEILRPIFINLKMLKFNGINIDFTHYNSHEPPPITNKYEHFLWTGNKVADYLAADT